MVDVLQDEIKSRLKEHKLSDEEIAELEAYFRRDNLIKPIENVMSKITDLEGLFKVLSDVKGLEGQMYEYKHQVRYLKGLLIDELVRYGKEANRSSKKLFGGKSPSKRLSKILADMSKELEESKYRLLSSLKKLMETASKDKPRDLIEKVGSLESGSNSEIEELLSNFPSLVKRRTGMLKKRDLRSLFAGKRLVEELGPYEVTENTIDNLLLYMEDIERYKKQLGLIGFNYIKVEEFSSIEENITYISTKYRKKKTYLKLNALFDYMKELKKEEEELDKLGKNLVSLDIKLEGIKENLLSKLAEKGLSKYGEMIKLVGINILKPPLTLYCSDDIEILREEVSKLQELDNLLKELLEELNNFPGNIKISLIDVPTNKEEEFIKGFINALRISKLSEGLPVQSYSSTGIINTVLDLYPKWRKRIMEILAERGSMSINELDFIPEIWRKWFINTLKEERVISISDGKIVTNAQTYGLLEKVRAKIDIIKDSLRDLGSYAGHGLTEELIQSYLNEFKRAKELISRGETEEATSILKELNSKLRNHLLLESKIDKKE